MMSAKMAPLGLLKKKYFDVLISVYELTKKFL